MTTSVERVLHNPSPPLPQAVAELVHPHRVLRPERPGEERGDGLLRHHPPRRPPPALDLPGLLQVEGGQGLRTPHVPLLLWVRRRLARLRVQAHRLPRLAAAAAGSSGGRDHILSFEKECGNLWSGESEEESGNLWSGKIEEESDDLWSGKIECSKPLAMTSRRSKWQLLALFTRTHLAFMYLMKLHWHE